MPLLQSRLRTASIRGNIPRLRAGSVKGLRGFSRKDALEDVNLKETSQT